MIRARQVCWDRLLRRLIVAGLCCTALFVPGPGWAKAPVNASIVLDAETGAVLAAVNADVQTYPASLAKIMTLYLLFDQLEQGRMKLADALPVSQHAAAQAPSKLGVRPGQSLTVEQVVLGLVTRSANDAAVVAAEAVAGSESRFAELMTEKARQIGLQRTVFRNASGLPHPGQVTTARDMALLGRAVARRHARYYHYFSTRQFSFDGAVISTHNRLMLNYDGADGIKTGFINASGFNLVASAVRGGRRLIGVVMGGSTARARDTHMAGLLDAGFGGRAAPEPVDEAEERASAKPVKLATAEPAEPAPKPPRPPAAKPPVAPARLVVSGTGDAEELGWAIQVGAYHRQDPAQALAKTLRQELRLPGRATVSSYAGRKNTIFRARIVGISEDQARQACRQLERQGKSCVVLPPA